MSLEKEQWNCLAGADHVVNSRGSKQLSADANLPQEGTKDPSTLVEGRTATSSCSPTTFVKPLHA
jgi:hypothetical protein